MKIDLVAWGETITGLTFKSGSHSAPVTALAFRYSKPIAYSGPGILEISRAPGSSSPEVTAAATAQILPAITARRKDNPNLVALAILPAESKHVTVLLAPAAAGTYVAYVLDDDPSKLPLGRLRIHNLSPHLIAMRCNNTVTTKLQPKQAVVVEPKKREVIYELAYQKDGAWVDQENNIATVREDEQAQLIVLQSEAEFFTSNDGGRAGFLQTVILRRNKNSIALTEMDPAAKSALEERLKREEEETERKHRPKR